MDDEIAFRFKILPIIVSIVYFLSKQIKRENVNPRLRVIAYPLYLAVSTEYVIKQQNLAALMQFAFT